MILHIILSVIQVLAWGARSVGGRLMVGFQILKASFNRRYSNNSNNSNNNNNNNDNNNSNSNSNGGNS